MTMLEIELKYFIDLRQRNLDSFLEQAREVRKIKQFFFSAERTAELWPDKVKELGGSGVKSRVRKINDKYIHSFKGPRQADYAAQGVVAKQEQEYEITKEEFSDLKKKTDQGSLAKSRYVFPAETSSGDSLVLEVDRLKSINGNSLKPLYLVAEIEVPDASFISKLRESDLQVIHGDVKTNFFELFQPIEVFENSSEKFAPLVSSRKLVRLFSKNKRWSAEMSCYFE